MFEPVAPRVVRLGIVFVNVFALGEPGGPWLLVDAGLWGSAGYIRRAVARRFGAGARPEGIVLTHGHFDHVGAAQELADSWSVYFTRRRELSRPSPPFTSDWKITHESIERLAELQPRVVAAGHGLEMTGDDVAQKLRGFTERFTPPRRGRYVGSPPVASEGDVEELPPVPDPYGEKPWGASGGVDPLRPGPPPEAVGHGGRLPRG